MSKHIPRAEQPLKAPPHKGSSPTPPASKAGSGIVGVGPSDVTEQQIAVRAYEIWLGRGGAEGAHEEDWAEARRQLHQQNSSPQSETSPLNPSR